MAKKDIKRNPAYLDQSHQNILQKLSYNSVKNLHF